MSVGILIDGAIIVVEYANRRANEGITKNKVFILSAKKMFIPVVASTSTTLAAFFPGQVFKIPNLKRTSLYE